MSLPDFDYIAANSLDEASKIAMERGNRGILMAGGTDVILQVKDRVFKDVDTVIDIKNIADLDERIEFTPGKGLRIGALAKLFTIQNSPVVLENIPAVAQAAHYVASSQIRRKGTMVGNICNASPSADTAPILLAMKATVKTYSPTGGREIPMDDFYTGFKQIAVARSEGEIVTEINIPELKSGEGSAYYKHAVRKAMDLAIIGVGAWVKMDGKYVADVRITMGGVGITTLRAYEAEKLLKGNEITDGLLEKAGVAASEESHPISDVRASAEYRSDMIRVYTKRAIKTALETLK